MLFLNEAQERWAERTARHAFLRGKRPVGNGTGAGRRSGLHDGGLDECGESATQAVDLLVAAKRKAFVEGTADLALEFADAPLVGGGLDLVGREELAQAEAIAASIAAGELGAGDMVICLGAGDITKMAAGLANAVEGAR